MIELYSHIPLIWLSNLHVWVEQWPVIESKLSILKVLVSEQLKMGHIESTTSKHNTHVFVIPKRSGLYCLLKELCAVNDQIEKIGSMEPGLPHPSDIPPS